MGHNEREACGGWAALVEGEGGGRWRGWRGEGRVGVRGVVQEITRRKKEKERGGEST